jgi:hypothetical protein
VAAPAFADSFLFVSHGQAITNGEPVNVKALKARHTGSYFWFSIDGKSYIVRDPKVLSRMKTIYEPLFTTGGDFTIGEQADLLSQQMTLMKEQLRIGLEPKAGEDSKTAARRVELKYEQNRLAERQNALAERANIAAEKSNDFAARLDDLNRAIEHQLHELGTQLIEQRIAVRDREM